MLASLSTFYFLTFLNTPKPFFFHWRIQWTCSPALKNILHNINNRTGDDAEEEEYVSELDVVVLGKLQVSPGEIKFI
jgi:hypothetical protein